MNPYHHLQEMGTVATVPRDLTMSEPKNSANHISRWRIYFDRALARDAVGDLLLLADEAPSSALQIDARGLLAKRLLARDRLQLAQEQVQAILAGTASDEHACALLATITEKARATTGSPPMPVKKAVLFSGHMIDGPNRPTARFPTDKESIAAVAIGKALDAIHVSSRDLAICGGACGGDTLFAEACLARGLRLHLHLQFEEPAFLDASVAFAGPRWVERYQRLASDQRTTVRIMPRELGPLPPDTNPYERNNLWQLYNALAAGSVDFIALWDGQGGDGPGGTEHLVKAVQRHGGQATILDTTLLW